MANIISSEAHKAYLDSLKSKKTTVALPSERKTHENAVENLALGALSLLPFPVLQFYGSRTKLVKGIEQLTGKDLSGLKKVAAVTDFVPSKLKGGAMGAVEGMTDFVAGGAAQFAKQKDAAKWIYEHSWSQDISGSQDVDEQLDNGSNGYRVASDIISGIGNVGLQVGIGLATGGAAQAGQISSSVASAIRWGSLFAQGAGSGTAEAVQKTGNVGWKENVAGLGSGAIEVLTEQISPTGKFISAKITGKTVDETAKFFAKHAIARSILSDFTGEFIEESSSYFLNWGLQNQILKIDDSPFSWKDWAYEGVMGGIAGGLFSSVSSISNIRTAQKAGAKVYAEGEDAVKRKISEGKVELDAMRKAGMDQDPRFKEGFDIAHRALTELETNDKLTQKQKELYLGLAERAVMTSQLTEYVADLAEFNAEQAKAGLVNTQALADSLNAVVREAGGESNFKAEDFLDKDSYANRVRAIAETFSQIMSPTVEVKAAKSIVDQSAPVFTGSKAQAQEIRNLAAGDVLTYNIGDGSYATITKRGGTDKYSIAYASAKSIADGKGVFTVANDQTVAQVMEIANKGWSGSEVDVMIENAEQAEAEAEERRVQTEILREQGVDEETLRKLGYIEGNKATAKQEQTEKPKRKPAQKKQNGKKTETKKTEAKKTEAKTAKIEDLSEVEQRLVPDLGIDRSSFTREEWIEARKYVPNIDTLDGERKARILTLVRTGNAMGINKTYLEGLVRISAVYNIGMLFTDRMPAKGFEVPTNKGAYVVINPDHLNTTYGHELFHTFAKGADGKTRADLVERIKKIVGAEAFDKAKAEYKKAYKEQFGTEISAELLDEEASASVVGNYLSNMTLLRKIAAKDAGLGRRLLGAIRNMKTRWTSAKAFAKENNSTTFAEYRKMTRIERLLMQELSKRQVEIKGLSEEEERRRSTEDHTQTVVQIWNEEQERIEQQEQEETEPFTQDPTPVTSDPTIEEPTTTEAQTTGEPETTEAPESTEETQEETTAETSDTTEETTQETAEATEQTEAPKQPKKRSPRKTGASSTTVTDGKEVTSNTAKIEDFGEKIGGARKDEWSKRGLQSSDLADMNEEEKNKYCKKDYVWKRPDYVKLVEAGGDRVLLYAYNELRKSLQSAVSFSRYANEETREASRSLYIETIRKVEAKLDTCTEKEDFDDLLNWLEYEGYLERYTGGWGYHLKQKYYDNPAFVSVGTYQSKNTFAYKVAEIVYHFDNLKLYADRAGFVTDVKNKLPPGFRVHKMTDGTFAIVKGKYIKEKGFATYEDAVKKILDTAKERKTKTRFVPVQLLEIHRKGYNYRSGKNVGGQDYLDTFGFRGGEFGNWLSEKDRQVSLNYGYDALLDMADALGIDAKSISLDGKLSIAFGSRGVSRALAHYEPMRRVINLTKMKGAGSLAHEWFHALDHHLTTADGKARPQKTIAELRAEAFRLLGDDADGSKQQGFIENANDGKYYASEYSSIIDAETKNALLSGKQGSYAISRSVEDHNAVKFVFVPVEDGFTLADYEDRKAHGSDSAIEKRDSANDNVRNAMRELEQAMTTAEDGSETQFLKDARRLDGSYSRDGGYWSSRNEMAARAFSTYVLDKLKAQNFRDDYLVGHAEAVATLLDNEGNVAYGYPRGEDRARINAAFDKLFETIKNEQILAEQKASERPDLVSYSPAPVSPSTDSEYMQLAQEPQKNESELRRLVKEAGRVAGFETEVYHGTRSEKPFTIFDFSKDQRGNRQMFFSDNRKISETYGQNVMSLLINTENFLTVDADGEWWTGFDDKITKAQAQEKYDQKLVALHEQANEASGKTNNFEFGTDEWKRAWSEAEKAWEEWKRFRNEEGVGYGDYDFLSGTTYDVAKYAFEHGYDGVIIKNVVDTADVSVEMPSTVYVIFESNRVKSADPVTYDNSGNIISLSERFNPQNDDIRYSPAEPQRRVVTRAQMPKPGITEKITNAKGQLNRRGLKNALDSASSAWESFKIVTVNAQQALENQLIRGGMTKRQAAAWSQLARTGRLHANNAIGYALADMTGEVRSDGLMKIITPFLAQKGEVYKAWDENIQDWVDVTAKGGELAGKRYDDFSEYLAMLNAIDRAKVGKNPYSNMTIGQMQKIVAQYEKANPDFKAASEQFSQYNNVMLDILVQSGMVSQELADKFRKKYPHYIPMRTADSTPVGSGAIRGSENLEVKRGLRTAEESNHRVDDPIKNYITQVESRIKAAKLNMLAIEIYETADGVNVVRGQDSRATAKELRGMEKKFLEDPLSMPDPTELFRKFQTGDNTRNEITFYKDGKMLTMAVSDRIYTGFTDLAGQHSAILDSNLAKLSKKINDTFKKLVTNWNPFFAVRNIARDLQDGLLQTQYGFFEFQQMYLKNAQMMASGKFNDLWVEFVANGGLESSLFSDEFATYTIGGKSGLEQAHGVVGQFQHIKNFNTLTEALPRFTEYCLTRKHGGSVQTALLNAADVTVNFGRGGTLTKILNSTVSPFLNPAVQGLDRVVRLFTENGLRNNKALASLLLKAFLLGILPMVLSNAMYGGDKEYEDMKDNVKENNYLFKIGNTWLKIPRGRVVSTISGLYNRSSKQATGQYVDWKDYGKNVLDQITPAQNVARHIASPFFDVANNKTWYGSAIESQSLQNYAVKDRYDENTSRIAVWIGQFTSHFGYSPKKVHYLLDQYTGVVGDILLPATTPAGNRGVVAYNFTVDANTSSNLSDRFYNLYNETMYASNAGDEEAYYLKRRLDETKSAASELFKEIKAINADSSLSNKEKVKQASAIRAMINQLYKTAIQDAKGYAANVKDALAIENSYGVVQIDKKNAKQYGLTSSDAGKYAVTFGDQAVKLYGSEKEATEYNGDTSKKTIYAEANRLTYGSEYALKEYNTNVYEKAKKLNELGISYDDYYNYYMTVRYYSGADKKKKILAYLNGTDLTKSQVALMMYYSGYTGYAEDAKKAIRASSLSADQKKELLAEIGK